MKKVLSVLLAALVLSTISYAAAANNIEIIINGEKQQFDQMPIIYEGTTLVPLRGVFEKFGADVNWVPDKRSVIILKGETNIKLAADSSIAVLNGKKTEIDVPPIILNGRLMVPVRFAAENLGVNVSWDETTQTVTLEKPDTKAGVINALREFDNLFDGDTISNWVYDLYDPEEGGFCFSKSAVGNLKYGPTIEGTYDTISIMNFMGLRGPVKDLPEPILSRLMNFLNERQDEASGYFYDKQFGNDINSAKLGRDLSMATSLYEYAGQTPPYPYPAQRLKATQQNGENNSSAEVKGANFLGSLEKTMEWVKSFDWTTSTGMWAAGNSIDPYFDSFKELGYLKDVLDFISSKQNPETGMWGDEISYAAVSGGAKFSSGYAMGVVPYPNLDKLLKSVGKIIENDKPENISHMWNVVIACSRGMRGYDKIPDEWTEALDQSIESIIREITYQLDKHFRRADGMFGYVKDSLSSGVTQGYQAAAPNMDEADTNSMVMLLNTRKELYNLAKLECPLICDGQKDEFLMRLGSKSPLQYYMPETVYETWEEDFGNSEICKKEIDLGFNSGSYKTLGAPYRNDDTGAWMLSPGDGFKCSIAKDDDNYLNKLLCIEKSNDGNCFLNRTDNNVPKTVDKFTIEYKFNIENLSGGFNVLNGVILQTTFVSSAGRVKLGFRKDGGSAVNEICTIDTGVWYDYKYEYEVQKDGSVLSKIYIDDKLVKETDIYDDSSTNTQQKMLRYGYTNGNPGRYWQLYAFTGSQMKLLIDDYKLTYALG